MIITIGNDLVIFTTRTLDKKRFFHSFLEVQLSQFGEIFRQNFCNCHFCFARQVFVKFNFGNSPPTFRGFSSNLISAICRSIFAMMPRQFFVAEVFVKFWRFFFPINFSNDVRDDISSFRRNVRDDISSFVRNCSSNFRRSFPNLFVEVFVKFQRKFSSNFNAFPSIYRDICPHFFFVKLSRKFSSNLRGFSAKYFRNHNMIQATSWIFRRTRGIIASNRL